MITFTLYPENKPQNYQWPDGRMVRVLVWRSGGCGFESHWQQILFSFFFPQKYPFFLPLSSRLFPLSLRVQNIFTTYREGSSFVTIFKIILKIVEFSKTWGESKRYLGHSRRSTSFVTLFRIILKLVTLLTNSEQTVKIFRTLWKVHKLCNCIQKDSEAFRIVNNLWGVRKNV